MRLAISNGASAQAWLTSDAIRIGAMESLFVEITKSLQQNLPIADKSCGTHSS
jgi:hypothetical protein